MPIPYAMQVLEAGKFYKICPRCDAKIELHQRKDFESFTGIEYQEHFVAEHA